MNTASASVALIVVTAALLTAGSSVALAEEGGVQVARIGIVRDDLPRTAENRFAQDVVDRGAWTSDALREFHTGRSTESAARSDWSAEAMREFKAGAARTERSAFTADVLRELKSTGIPSVQPTPRSLTSEQMRELKGAPSRSEEPSRRMLTEDELRELKGSTPGSTERR